MQKIKKVSYLSAIHVLRKIEGSRFGGFLSLFLSLFISSCFDGFGGFGSCFFSAYLFVVAVLLTPVSV